MPTTRRQSSSGTTSRGPTAADAGFTATLQTRDTIVTPGSTVTSTVDDRSITTQTGATVDRAGDIDCVETVQGTFTPYLRFESLNTGIATVDSVGNVTRVSNGTARILCHTRLKTEPVDVPVSRTTDTTIVFNGYIAGSLAKECSDAVDDRIDGLTASTAKPIFTTANHDAATYTRNVDCWTTGIDLTCVSPWNSNSGTVFGVTAISPRHVILARHVVNLGYFPNGTTIRFITAAGVVVTRTLTAKQSIAGSGNTYDLTVGLLDSALPSSITPAKVLPANLADYLPSLSSLYSVPCLVIDRDDQALIAELNSLSGNFAYFHQPVDATRANYYEQLISGDSGNAAFMLIDDEPVLLTTWTFGGGGAGPKIHALHTEINAAMTTLGGSQQLAVKSLSSFTDFS